MMVGAKRELVLVRTIDFGGRVLLETLMALSGETRESVLQALEHEDEMMVENTRMALMVLMREIGSSIGFFEGRREETIDRIFVSGAPAKSQTLLKVMSEEVHMPCESWNALGHCEIAVPVPKATAVCRGRPRLERGLRRRRAASYRELIMALRLNLYHEIERQKQAQRRDPLKLSMFALGIMAVLFAGYYVWQLGVSGSVSRDLSRKRAEFKALEPQASSPQNIGKKSSRKR